MTTVQIYTILAIGIYAIAMALSFVIVPLVSAYTKKEEGNRVEEIFACYSEE